MTKLNKHVTSAIAAALIAGALLVSGTAALAPPGTGRVVSSLSK